VRVILMNPHGKRLIYLDEWVMSEQASRWRFCRGAYTLVIYHRTYGVVELKIFHHDRMIDNIARMMPGAHVVMIYLLRQMCKYASDPLV
jgi:hypothetical protein